MAADEHDPRLLIADRIESLAIELRSISDKNLKSLPTETTLLNAAQKVYAARREADRVFGVPGFSNSPAWDMMLDLYVAKTEHKEISVTSACLGASCAPTTGLRWLQLLEEMHLVRRRDDIDDRRRILIELTEGGKVKVAKALSLYL